MRGELGSEHLDFLNMRLQGQGMPGCSLEMGKMKIRLKDVGVWLPALDGFVADLNRFA